MYTDLLEREPICLLIGHVLFFVLVWGTDSMGSTGVMPPMKSLPDGMGISPVSFSN